MSRPSFTAFLLASTSILALAVASCSPAPSSSPSSPPPAKPSDTGPTSQS